MPNPDPKTFQDFSLLEKEALKEISLDIIKSDLQKSLKELHQKSMKDVTDQISTIELKCVKEIQENLEHQIQTQLSQNFQQLLESYQSQIDSVLAPLVKRAEKDVTRLNDAVNETNQFCQKIEAQYTGKWDRPFFTLVSTAAFAGGFMGLILLFLQVPLLSVLFMNKDTREAYDIGISVLNYRKEQKGGAQEQESQMKSSEAQTKAQSEEKSISMQKTTPKAKISDSSKKKKKAS